MNHHHRTNAHTRPKSGKTNAYQRFALNSPDCVVNDVEHQKNKQFSIIRARPKIVLPTFTCVTFCTAMAGLIIYVGCPHTHTHSTFHTRVPSLCDPSAKCSTLCLHDISLYNLRYIYNMSASVGRQARPILAPKWL